MTVETLLGLLFGLLIVLLALFTNVGRLKAAGYRDGITAAIVLPLTLWVSLAAFKATNLELLREADAAKHRRLMTENSRLLEAGDFVTPLSDCVPGNRGFRFLGGVWLYASGLPHWTIRLLSTVLGFSAAVQAFVYAATVGSGPPPKLRDLTLFVLFPSLPFWCTEFLKEGFTLWGGCAMLTLATDLRKSSLRFGHGAMRVEAVVAVALLLWLRPHFAICWMGGFAIAKPLVNRKFGQAVVYGGLMVSCFVLLSITTPEFMEKMTSDGVTDTMNSAYEKNSNLGGSAIGGGPPIPFVSGVFNVFLSPFLTITQGLSGLLCAAESILLCLVCGPACLRLIRRKAPGCTTTQMSVLAGLAVLMLYFGYLYNVGLIVRQRVFIVPSLLAAAMVVRKMAAPLPAGPMKTDAEIGPLTWTARQGRPSQYA